MSCSLPENVEDWNTDHVIQWGQLVVGLDEDELALLRKEKYSGISLRRATRDSLKSDGFAGGTADTFLFARDKLFPAAGEDAAPPEPKRNKTLAALVSSNDFDAVIKELLHMAAPFRGNAIVDPKAYRVPYHEMGGTWNEDLLKRQLISMRKDARLRLKAYKDDDGSRDPIVIAIRNGSGFGKTHILTEAPRLLSATGIYVTYNKNQNLRVDSDKTEQAIILRLILVLAGYAPRECSAVLVSEDAVPFLGIPEQWLQALFLAYVDKLTIGEIAICVDETQKLPLEAARRAMSALTSLAARYLETKDAMCTIIVSTLNTDTFKTISDRTLSPWPIARPDHTTLEFFAYLFPEEDKEKIKALANALSGAHIRSIVYCFQLGQEDINASIKFLMNRMDQVHGANTTNNDLVEVRAHIEASITSPSVPKVSHVVEGLSDNRKAVPPCYILRSYEENNAALSILKALFGSFSLYNSPGKQLEEVGRQYDLFRATMELPVVPGRAEVHIPPGVAAERKWFKELKFPSSLVVDKSAILEQQNVAGSTRKMIVATEVRPKTGCCYHPKVENHPWIDRLYVAYHFGDKKECIVLIQDKVNSADYSKACEKLELAANVLSKAHGFSHVLLIVNVIGASDQTIAHKKLTWPHILVRGEDGVRNYYSESFADVVYYARRRHQMSLQE